MEKQCRNRKGCWRNNVKKVAGHESPGSPCPHPNPGSKTTLKLSLVLGGRKAGRFTSCECAAIVKYDNPNTVKVSE